MRFLVIRVPKKPSTIRHLDDSPEIRTAERLMDKVLLALSNSSWNEKWSEARKDLQAYRPDMIGQIAKELKDMEAV